MTYYILLPNDTEQDVINDTNILGEYQSLNNTFHTQQGFQVFMKLINSYPDKVKDIRIEFNYISWQIQQFTKDFHPNDFQLILRRENHIDQLLGHDDGSNALDVYSGGLAIKH